MADDDPNETALGRGRTARWVLITGGAQIVRVGVTIASAAILGRLLTPSDFGLVATVAPLIALTSMLQNLGLNQALIQRPNLERAHVNALFYLTLAASLVLLAVLFLLAPLIAGIFTEPRLTAIVQVMAVLAVIAAAASTPMGLMNRRLHFARLAAIDIAAPLIGLAAGAAVAFATRSYWSLVVMQGVTVTAQLIGALLLGQWSPGRARFDADLRAMIGLGAGFSTFNLLNFLSRNADNVLIAYAHGPAALGLYERSYRLMLNPLMQAMAPFGRVLMPVLARLQTYPTLYRQHFAESTALLMSAVQPAVVAALVFPVSTVTLVLGDHWAAAAPIFFWLATTALHQIYVSTFGWLFISQGRARDFATLGALGAAIAVASFIAGLPYGPLGVAFAFAVADILFRAPLALWLAGASGPLNRSALLAHFAPHAVASAASALMLLAVSRSWPQPHFWELSAAVLLSYAVYAPVLCLFPSKRRIAVHFGAGALRRLRAVYRQA